MKPFRRRIESSHRQRPPGPRVGSRLTLPRPAGIVQIKMIGRAASTSLNRLRIALVTFALVVAMGSLGYMLVEGWTPLEAVYMTVITLTTVGFGEVHPLTIPGKVFTMFLVLGGVGMATYTVFAATEVLVEKQMLRVLGKGRMDEKLKKQKGHIIVCGFGRVGRQICEEFKRREVPFVVVERSKEATENAQGFPIVHGDATEDATLLAAGIEGARGLVCALSSEAENVFITLSARQLNAEIRITARADSEGMEHKLLRAGATRVVSPYQAGAMRMAITTLQPNVVDFMSIVAGGESTGLRLEEVEVATGSAFIGKSLRQAEFRQRYGLMVVGIKRAGLQPLFSPASDEVIQDGDVMLLIGSAKDLGRLAEGAAGNQER
jgi:voltage-gated potassium channel